MKLFTAAAIAATIAILSSAASAETRTIDATGFSTIDISAGIKANITIGETFSVKVDAPRASDLENLRVFADGNTLHARYDFDIFHVLDFPGRDVTLTITMPKLEAVDASSASRLTADGTGGDRLRIDASSGAHVEISGADSRSYSFDTSSGSEIIVAGTCNDVAADASSGSHISARKLICAEGHADVSSGANVELAVAETISADASSGGHISITGRPRVQSMDSSSGGGIEFLD